VDEFASGVRTSGAKVARGNASQFFVAGELCRRGWSAVVTLGNTPNTDIFVSDSEGTRFVHVQVKTFHPGNRTVTVGRKAEKNYGERFVWVLGGIPEAGSGDPFQYFIVPSAVMAQRVSAAHAAWLRDPGRNGHVRKDSNVLTVTLPPWKDYLGWSVEEISRPMGHHRQPVVFVTSGTQATDTSRIESRSPIPVRHRDRAGRIVHLGVDARCDRVRVVRPSTSRVNGVRPQQFVGVLVAASGLCPAC
jgi:hypothetical protein